MAKIVVYMPLTSPYARIVDSQSGNQLQVSTGVLTYIATWANQAITPYTFDASMGKGVSVFTIPALPDGEYDLLVHDNATPVTGDAVQVAKHFRVKNNNLVSNPNVAFIDM